MKERVAWGGAFEGTVTLMGAVEGGFELGLLVEDGTTDSSDYTAPTSPILFTGTGGETQAFAVTTIPDDIVELDELFSVALGALAGLDPSAVENITVDPTSIPLSIVNDDEATLSLAPVAMNEGTATTPTTFLFTVTLSHPVQAGFRVGYATSDDTATTADGDYLAANGSLEFTGARDEVQNAAITVVADARVERDESFFLSLLQPTDAFGNPLDNVTVAGPAMVSGQIQNDDFAMIGFFDAASLTREQDGSHALPVVLSVPGGGSLSEAITVDIIDLGTGSASTPADYRVLTSSLTFAAGSTDGDTQTVNLEIVVDQPLEDIETIQLGLALTETEFATVGPVAFHQVEVVDDPMTGSLIGFVWVDEDGDGVFDANEMPLADVTIDLSGEDVFQDPITRQSVTDASGRYEFTGLPIGLYEISEQQPDGFNDGADFVGTVDGALVGMLGDDEIVDIVLGPGQSGLNYNFTEREPLRLSMRLFLTSVLGSQIDPDPVEDEPAAISAPTARLQALARFNQSPSAPAAASAAAVVLPPTTPLPEATELQRAAVARTSGLAPTVAPVPPTETAVAIAPDSEAVMPPTVVAPSAVTSLPHTTALAVATETTAERAAVVTSSSSVTGAADVARNSSAVDEGNSPARDPVSREPNITRRPNAKRLRPVVTSTPQAPRLSPQSDRAEETAAERRRLRRIRRIRDTSPQGPVDVAPEATFVFIASATPTPSGPAVAAIDLIDQLFASHDEPDDR